MKGETKESQAIPVSPEPDRRTELSEKISRAARIERLQQKIQAPELTHEQVMAHIERLRTPNAAYGAIGGLTQGITFGFADEVKGAVRAIWDRLPDEDYGDAYLRIRNDTRRELEAFRKNRPVLSIGSEITGGILVPGSLTGSAVVKGTTTGAKIARGAVAGAVAGGAYGAGSSEEIEDIPKDVVSGSVTGAAFGAALPAGVAAVRAGGRAIQGTFNPASGATRRIAQAVVRDEMTPNQILAAIDEAKQLGKPVTIADVGGEAIRRELDLAVQTPGQAAQIADKFLASRNKDQLTRITKDLVSGTGVKADDVEEAIVKTMRLRQNAAKPIYQRAMDFHAELNDDIVEAYQRAIKTPLGKAALHKARKILNVENFYEAPLMERVDALKKGLDDVIGSAKRKGEGAIAAKALSVKKEIVGLVDAVNPDYKKARKIWENTSNYLDAIDRGRDILRPSMTSAKLKQELAELTDSEIEAFRIGAVDSIVTRMRQQSAQEPNLIKIVRSPEIRDKLKMIMKPDSASRIDKILDIEDAMFKTASQARHGSQTAQRQAAMAEQQKQIGLQGLVEELTSLVITPLRNIVVHRIPSMSRAAKERMIAKQNAQIAKRLLSSDPDEVLRIPIPTQPFVTGGRMIPGAIAAEEEQE